MREKSKDFVIITALREERDALLKIIPSLQRLPPSHKDVHIYYQAGLPVTLSDGMAGTYELVLLSLLGMGRVNAANATNNAIHRWHPHYILLVGIAGGVAEAGVQCGDVLIADPVADYESQKLTVDGESIRWDVHRADPRLLETALHLGKNWSDQVKEQRPIRGKPEYFIGPVITGDKVVAIKDVLDSYRGSWTKLIGIEMEAGGVASAAFQAADRPGFLMIRGVSDLADQHKDDTWRSYACHVAAVYTLAFLQSGPIPFSKQAEESSSYQRNHQGYVFYEEKTETHLKKLSENSHAKPDTLRPNQILGAGQQLASPSNQFMLIMQEDGNLVERTIDGQLLWDSDTEGYKEVTLHNQEDGNIVLIARDNRPIWATHTDRKIGAVLQIQDDGDVVVVIPGEPPLSIKDIPPGPKPLRQ